SPPDTRLMKKFDGGIGSLARHVRGLFEAHGGELRLRAQVDRVLTEGKRVTGVELKGGDVITSPIVISNVDPGVTFTKLMDPDDLPPDLVTRVSNVDHRAAYVQMHFALDGLPEYAPPFDFLNTPELQGTLGLFGSAEAVINKLTRLAPNFRDLIIRHTTFASFHMETMFGCPDGDFCHGLIHPDLMGQFRPGPRGWLDMPVPVDGLYLGGAGCHGGP